MLPTSLYKDKRIQKRKRFLNSTFWSWISCTDKRGVGGLPNCNQKLVLVHFCCFGGMCEGYLCEQCLNTVMVLAWPQTLEECHRLQGLPRARLQNSRLQGNLPHFRRTSDGVRRVIWRAVSDYMKSSEEMTSVIPLIKTWWIAQTVESRRRLQSSCN